LALSLLQPGEELEHPIHRLLQRLAGGGLANAVRAEVEVLLDRQCSEHPASFRDVDHPHAGQLVGQVSAELRALQGDLAALNRHQSGDGLEQGRFARAICAQDGNDMPLLDFE